MRIAKYTKIIVALLMMTFIGQTVASTAMSCLNEVPKSQLQEQVMESSAMDHTQHAGMNTNNTNRMSSNGVGDASGDPG